MMGEECGSRGGIRIDWTMYNGWDLDGYRLTEGMEGKEHSARSACVGLVLTTVDCFHFDSKLRLEDLVEH
jgi:hypothetical protein